MRGDMARLLVPLLSAKHTTQKNVKKTIKPTFFKHREGHAIATNTHTHVQLATTATTNLTITWATAFHRLQVPTISQSKAKNT